LIFLARPTRRADIPGSDNGPEVVSKALLSWIVAQGIATALIEPGKRKRKSDRWAADPHISSNRRGRAGRVGTKC
jgi:hypothetical protein